MTKANSMCNTAGDCTEATRPQISTLRTHPAKQVRSDLQESEANTQSSHSPPAEVFLLNLRGV